MRKITHSTVLLLVTLTISIRALAYFPNSEPGTTLLSGKVTGPANGQIFLYASQGKSTFKLDSTKIQNFIFTFPAKSYETGIYMLAMNDRNMCPIIINSNEPEIDIQFKGGMLEAGFTTTKSKENEGWAQYFNQETTLLKLIRDNKTAARKAGVSNTDYEKAAAAKEMELAKLRQTLRSSYSGTFFASILQWKEEPTLTDITGYWDNIDFNDERIVRTRVLSDRIESFMRTFSKGEESGFLNCVAIVADKAKVNAIVLEFVLQQMLTGFYESNMENICTFIIDNYIHGDACGDVDLSNIIKSTAESIANLGIGRTPPNIQLQELKGSAFDLYATCATHKYTLIMFWSSWCEHCKGEAPQVKACWDQWHQKGFEIVGVSIDRSKAPWENAINERQFTFPNVCGMNEFQSPVAKDYRITRTPAFFLLDQEKRIVLKPKSIKEVQTYLSQNLK